MRFLSSYVPNAWESLIALVVVWFNPSWQLGTMQLRGHPTQLPSPCSGLGRSIRKKGETYGLR